MYYNQLVSGSPEDIKTGSEIRDKILKANSKALEINNYDQFRQDLWRLEQRFNNAIEILIEELEALKGKAIFVSEKS